MNLLLMLLATTIATPMLFGQTAPTLGTTATYGAFTSTGGIANTGLTQITGDIGTNAGAFTGFPPGAYSGAKHVADPASLVAKNDLTIAWNQLGALACGATLSITMGNGQVLTPNTYCASGASTLTGNLTLDAQGNPNAIFIIKISGALNAASTSRIILANLAQAANVYWRIDGAVSILDNSIFKGTIVANGAIHLYGGTALEGRALSIVGAVTMASNMMAVPATPAPARLTVTRPATGDTLIAGTQNYRIDFTGVSVTLRKLLEYSLDGGTTWKNIGTIRSQASSYLWNVPDTSSTKALIRITDSNGVAGTSGMFIIGRTVAAGSLTVTRPAAGDTLIGGTQNYRIDFIGTNLALRKKFEYSLDNGATWMSIGTTRSDALSFLWNVPDTASTKALVRVTDSNGVTGTSGMFTIKTTAVAGSLTITRPAAGDTLIGGTQSYQIGFTGTNVTLRKTIEYSLDAGATWMSIGTIRSDASFYLWNVPETPSMQALIRITDSNGVTGTSGMFIIKQMDSVINTGAISSLSLGGVINNQIANNQPIDISWAFNPDIGTSVDVEYSLDGANTWTKIATVPTNMSPSAMWFTPSSGTYDAAFIRVTSTLGMQRMSDAFKISTAIAGVGALGSVDGYAIENFPNPVSDVTTIRFLLPVRSVVKIAIADGLGREVSTVTWRSFEAGSYGIPFNASQLPSGLYTYTLEAGKTRVTGTMTVVK